MQAPLRLWLLIPLLGLIIACRNESTGAVNNPGSGSGTLNIDAEITAGPDFSNASDPNDFKVEAVIKIEDAQGVTVEDAVANITSKSTLTIPHDKNGVYKAEKIIGYDRIYTLDILRGNDSVAGVTVTGPENHTITIGNPGQTPNSVKASEPVTVYWDPAGYADSVLIETKYYETWQDDTGKFEIPKGGFTEGVPDYIQITREKSLNPAGALAGSIVTVRVRNWLEPVTVEP